MKDGMYIECPGPQGFIEVDSRGGACGGKAKAERYKRAIKLAKKGDFDKMEEEHPDMYWNSYHTMKRIAMDNPTVVKDLDRLDNQWIWGPPRVGKSRTARRENPGIYIKLHNKWWLGYKGEEAVLYDDLGKTDSNWIGEFLKQWADHYCFPAETKGDGMIIRPKRIIVTSNYSIEELFGHDEMLCEAIKSRFKVRHMVQPFANMVAPAPAAGMVIIPEDPDPRDDPDPIIPWLDKDGRPYYYTMEDSQVIDVSDDSE